MQIYIKYVIYIF